MPRRPSPLSLACSVSTALALVLLAAPPARAQNQRKGILPDGDSQKKFLTDYAAAKKNVFDTINKAIDGEKANKENAEHKAAIDLVAQYYTYRLTWDVNGTPGEVDKLMSEFFAQVVSANSAEMRKGNPVFSEMYLKALAARARDVVQTNQMIAAVNAARMLDRLADTGTDEAGDACLEVVKNANDFVDPTARMGAQYWALKGLGSLLGRWSDPPLGADGAPAPLPADRKDREAKYVEGLVATIEKFIPADGKSSAGVAEGSPEEMGLQMFRREAVRSLAQYRGPAVDDKGTIKVKSALALLKVTNDDGLSPPARLDEQMEAAWGLARIRAKGLASYQPDYAAQQMGYVVVQMALNAKKQDPNKVPWKYYAARLADALELMRDDAKGLSDKAGAAYVDKMAGQALRVLKDIELKESSGAGGDLKLWLGTNAPPHDTLYKGVADSTVRPLERPDTPEKPDKPEKPKEEKKPGDKKPDEKKPGKP
jgi:hypothetical protein